MAAGAVSAAYCPACLLTLALGEEPGAREGEWIGPYRIVDTLGEGGMGVVYLAEQEHPIRRRVAIKVIKIGMDTREVVARFEAERQTLALMDHPHIARVLDAGANAEGRPYFVMEYVAGLPIVEFCDRQRLSIAARLDLMQHVCAAVQHAHQRGIIHRDLKPSNVLVAMQDDRAVPKVIDFGVAKAIDQDALVHTVFTEHGRLLGTPEYMSPEQVSLGGSSIDTRSDIYSLGVMLYELLAGALPFEATALRRAGHDEIRRIIREVEPLEPSRRVAALGRPAAPAATSRRTHPAGLEKQLRGDLDWITLKALEKDPARRYASASELAADIARYVRHEPVTAGPPSATYRVRKFVRKHRMAVGVASLFVALLGAAATVSTVLFLRAEAARREADRRRVQADQAREATDEQRRVAEAARVEAGRERAVAESQAGAAEAARVEAERQRDAAERRAYRINIVAADLSLAAAEIREARRLLEICPPQLRGWEWRYLYHNADASIQVLRAPAASDGSPPIASFDALRFVRDRLVAFGTRSGSPSNADALAEWSGLGTPPPGPPPRSALRPLDPNSSVLAVSGDGTRLLVARWHGARPTARPARAGGEGATGGTVELRVDNAALAERDRNRVVVLDARSGQTVSTFALDQVGVWSGPGRDAGVIGLSPASPWRRTAAVVDSVLRRPVATVSYPVAIQGALNADGTRAAAWSWDNVIHVWDVTAERPLARLSGHSDFIVRAVFAADSRRLVTGSRDRTVRVWDLSSGRATAVLGPQPTAVTAIAVAGSAALIAAGFDDRTIRLWRDGTLLPDVLRGHAGPATSSITSLAFDRNGARLASSSLDRTVRVWDTVRMSEILVLRGHEDAATGVAFSPDDSRIASSSLDGTIRLWNAASTVDVVFPGLGPIRGVAFADRAGSDLAAVQIDDVLRIWDLKSGSVARQTTLPGETASLAVDAGRGRLAVGLVNQATRARPRPDVSAIVLDSRTLGTVATLAGQSGIVASAAFSGDGARLATASPEGVWLWDLASSRELRRWPGGRAARGVSLSRDGALVAAGYAPSPSDRGAGLLIWPAPAVAGADRPPIMTSSVAATVVAFAAGGTRIVSGDDEGLVRVWDVGSGRPVATLRGHDAAVQSLAVSPDGHRLASAGADRTVRIWNLDTGELLLTLRVGASVQSVAFSADGERLAAGILGGPIRVWYSAGR